MKNDGTLNLKLTWKNVNKNMHIGRTWLKTNSIVLGQMYGITENFRVQMTLSWNNMICRGSNLAHSFLSLIQYGTKAWAFYFFLFRWSTHLILVLENANITLVLEKVHAQACILKYINPHGWESNWQH